MFANRPTPISARLVSTDRIAPRRPSLAAPIVSILFVTLWTLIFAVASTGRAEPPSDSTTLEGHWEGGIEVPGVRLDVDVDFERFDGQWRGDISIPLQNAKDLTLDSIAIEGDRVTFAIAGVPGDPVFTGTFSEDGSKIVGTLAQGGQSFPFELIRRPSKAAAAAEKLEGFEAFLERAIETWEVPGLAAAVVVDGTVVFAEGVGWRDAENRLPVTPKTLFAIGSTTKAFTTAALGMLVEEDRLEWDAPVRRYLPGFELKDPLASQLVTVRDLVTHRTGLPRHDAVWYNNNETTRAALVERLAHLDPTADLRERFQYSNLMYLAAGHLLEVITGSTWEDFLRERLLDPLGMTASNFSVLESQKSPDHAVPHSERDDEVERIPFRRLDVIGPAGSINSNAEEMSRWIRWQLAGGEIEGKRLLGSSTLAEMHAPQMVTGQSSPRADISSPSYGLGWMVDVYRGHRRVHHGGGIDGFLTNVALFPDDGIGLVVFVNRDGNQLPELVTRHVVDRLLDLERVDWMGNALEGREASEKAKKKKEEERGRERKEGTVSAHALADYAGEYLHAGYGPIVVRVEDDGLVADYNGIRAPLEHWHYEVFRATEEAERPIADSRFRFDTDMDGEVTRLWTKIEPSLPEVRFERQPDPRATDPDHLAKLAGRYDLDGVLVVIDRKGSVLTMTVPGQPAYELVPKSPTEFTLKPAPFVTVTFRLEGDEVRAILIDQPEGTFEAKRED